MKTMNNHSLVNRRTLLKGAGVSLALPLMDSLAWAAGGNPAKPPVRLGFMYMPHGVIMDDFWPKSPEAYHNSPPPAIDTETLDVTGRRSDLVREDVRLLAERFLERAHERAGRGPARIAREALASLERYSWPGNVRELENVIERAVALGEALGREGGEAEQVVAPVLDHVDRQVVASQHKELGADLVSEHQPLPFELAVERGVFRAEAVLDFE